MQPVNVGFEECDLEVIYRDMSTNTESEAKDSNNKFKVKDHNNKPKSSLATEKMPRSRDEDQRTIKVYSYRKEIRDTSDPDQCIVKETISCEYKIPSQNNYHKHYKSSSKCVLKPGRSKKKKCAKVASRKDNKTIINDSSNDTSSDISFVDINPKNDRKNISSENHDKAENSLSSCAKLISKNLDEKSSQDPCNRKPDHKDDKCSKDKGNMESVCPLHHKSSQKKFDTYVQQKCEEYLNKLSMNSSPCNSESSDDPEKTISKDGCKNKYYKCLKKQCKKYLEKKHSRNKTENQCCCSVCSIKQSDDKDFCQKQCESFNDKEIFCADTQTKENGCNKSTEDNKSFPTSECPTSKKHICKEPNTKSILSSSNCLKTPHGTSSNSNNICKEKADCKQNNSSWDGKQKSECKIISDTEMCNKSCKLYNNKKCCKNELCKLSSHCREIERKRASKTSTSHNQNNTKCDDQHKSETKDRACSNNFSKEQTDCKKKKSECNLKSECKIISDKEMCNKSCKLYNNKENCKNEFCKISSHCQELAKKNASKICDEQDKPKTEDNSADLNNYLKDKTDCKEKSSDCKQKSEGKVISDEEICNKSCKLYNNKEDCKNELFKILSNFQNLEQQKSSKTLANQDKKTKEITTCKQTICKKQFKCKSKDNTKLKEPSVQKEDETKCLSELTSKPIENICTKKNNPYYIDSNKDCTKCSAQESCNPGNRTKFECYKNYYTILKKMSTPNDAELSSIKSKNKSSSSDSTSKISSNTSKADIDSSDITSSESSLILKPSEFSVQRKQKQCIQEFTNDILEDIPSKLSSKQSLTELNQGILHKCQSVKGSLEPNNLSDTQPDPEKENKLKSLMDAHSEVISTIKYAMTDVASKMYHTTAAITKIQIQKEDASGIKTNKHEKGDNDTRLSTSQQSNIIVDIDPKEFSHKISDDSEPKLVHEVCNNNKLETGDIDARISTSLQNNDFEGKETSKITNEDVNQFEPKLLKEICDSNNDESLTSKIIEEIATKAESAVTIINETLTNDYFTIPCINNDSSKYDNPDPFLHEKKSEPEIKITNIENKDITTMSVFNSIKSRIVAMFSKETDGNPLSRIASNIDIDNPSVHSEESDEDLMNKLIE